MRARTAVAATSVALALMFTGCGGQNATSKQQSAPTTASPSPTLDLAAKVRAWAEEGGTDTLNTLAKRLGKVDKDSHPVNLVGLQDSCAQLTADVETAQGEAPMPDVTLDKRWKLALYHLGKSASACTVGAASGDQASFDLMSAEMSIGNEHLNAVAKRINEITVGSAS
ncbi:hypothetical protein AB0C59_30680 [Streptomyces sp. NPDC048664]|uniref:hypothetical protein n=1 Tax=Streptomyces sp. NPDC048664 TaxID=3154505 RepID=UPI003421FCF5